MTAELRDLPAKRGRTMAGMSRDRPLLSDTGGGGVKLAPRDFG